MSDGRSVQENLLKTFIVFAILFLHASTLIISKYASVDLILVTNEGQIDT